MDLLYTFLEDSACGYCHLFALETVTIVTGVSEPNQGRWPKPMIADTVARRPGLLDWILKASPDRHGLSISEKDGDNSFYGRSRESPSDLTKGMRGDDFYAYCRKLASPYENPN